MRIKQTVQSVARFAFLMFTAGSQKMTISRRCAGCKDKHYLTEYCRAWLRSPVRS
jgi:hypothetical protein